jgi:tetratricopeptide (TPR) repeat protein
MDSVVHDLAPRRDRFSPLERLWLEHFEALIAGDNELAMRTIRQMAEVAPGSWLGGQSALALMTNRPREALHALLQADLERGFLRNWGYYWALRTTARHLLGQHRQELTEARRARSQQPELLRSRFAELRSLAALGRVRELERLLEESRLLPADPEWTPADLLRSTAAELRAHGHTDAAERALQEAVGWYLGRPADEQSYQRAALASTLYEARRWDEARALFQELLSEQPEDIAPLGYLGALAARRGDRAEAERVSASLAASTQPYLRGAHTLWRARIAALLGDREQALALLHESLAQGQIFLLRLHTDADLDPLRNHPSFRELLRPKG